MGSPWRPRGPDDLDDDQRARIRRQVLGSVGRLRRSPMERAMDRAYDVFSLLAVPAPYIVRSLILAGMIIAAVGSASVASADSLPDEPLYRVKVASEHVRLALARTPEDRASVELSMAEHRLAEAVRLVQAGRGTEAIGVTSAYGTHLANAAAELATVERLSVGSRPVVEQLKQRLAEQQHQAADMAARFAGDPNRPVAAVLFRTIASFAPALPSGTTVSEGIAEHAASVADQLAAVAERLAQAAAQEEQEEEGVVAPTHAPPPAAPAARQEPLRAPAAATPPRAAPTARPTSVPQAAVAQRTEPARATAAVGNTGATVRASATATPTAKPTAKASAKPTPDPKKVAEAKAAAEKAKQEAEKARIAAQKAKEAAKKTATPKPTPRR